MSADDWRVTGDWFDACSCNIPCPCSFAQPPTDNPCVSVTAYHITSGNYGKVRLDDLTYVALLEFEGDIWAGEASPIIWAYYVDERADEHQREALDAIWTGRAGGWPAKLGEILGDLGVRESRGAAYVPIKFAVADDLSWWEVEIPHRIFARGEPLTGPASPSAQAWPQLVNGPGSETGGSPITWGQATRYEIGPENFGLRFRGAKSSKHIPFDWSGKVASAEA
jgi:hypothetical protein